MADTGHQTTIRAHTISVVDKFVLESRDTRGTRVSNQCCCRPNWFTVVQSHTACANQLCDLVNATEGMPRLESLLFLLTVVDSQLESELATVGTRYLAHVGYFLTRKVEHELDRYGKIAFHLVLHRQRRAMKAHHE